MKKMTVASLVTLMTLSSVYATPVEPYGSAMESKVDDLQKEVAKLQKMLKKYNKKLYEVKAHDANDNIKWGADLRTSIDYINYLMASGEQLGNKDLMSMRLWLDMEFAPDSKNIFKGQLSMNKAAGADFGYGNQSSNSMNRALSMGGMFDWTSNEALADNSMKVRQAYWLYLGEDFRWFEIPWTFSLGRRPSTNGFLTNLREDDEALSPLGHVINVEFDGGSAKLDLAGLTGVNGMSLKFCIGRGATGAAPLFDRLDGAQYTKTGLPNINLAGFIFEPYNDGQYIVKTTAFSAFNLPGFNSSQFMKAFNANDMGVATFTRIGMMDGGAVSVLVDGLTEEGFFSNMKVFGSYALSHTRPYSNQYMLGLNPAQFDLPATTSGYGAAKEESKTGNSYWIGAQWKCMLHESAKLGLEFNHGDEYWRPFTYAEDTMAGSKIATRGNAYEAYATVQLTDALSAQLRLTQMDYDYTGSNGFFGSDGMPMKIEDVKSGANQYDKMKTKAGITSTMPMSQQIGKLMSVGATQEEAVGMVMAKYMEPTVVERARDIRFYLRYKY